MKRITLIIAVFLLAACASTPSSSIEGDWKLVSYGEARYPTPALEDVDATISFDSKGQMSGNVGCNGFGGKYEVKDGTLLMSEVMSTMMFCDATSQQEQGVLSVLSSQTGLEYELNGDTLKIKSVLDETAITMTRK